MTSTASLAVWATYRCHRCGGRPRDRIRPALGAAAVRCTRDVRGTLGCRFLKPLSAMNRLQPLKWIVANISSDARRIAFMRASVVTGHTTHLRPGDTLKRSVSQRTPVIRASVAIPVTSAQMGSDANSAAQPPSPSQVINGDTRRCSLRSFSASN